MRKYGLVIFAVMLGALAMSVNGQMITNTYFWPDYGELEAGESLWANAYTEPVGTLTNLQVVYSADDGATWSALSMNYDGVVDSTDRWYVDMGAFASGARIQFAIRADDAGSVEYWDNNDGQNYRVRVSSLIRDVYTDRVRYEPGGQALIKVDLFNDGATTVTGMLHFAATHLFAAAGSNSVPFALEAGQGTNVAWSWTLPQDDFRGYGVDVSAENEGTSLDARSTAIDVSSDWIRFPRYGFFSDYYEGETAALTEEKVEALSRYHISAAQFYDWNWQHDRLIPRDGEGQYLNIYTQFDGRVQSLATVTNKLQAAQEKGMARMAYSLVYGDSGNNDAPEELGWGAFTSSWAATANQMRRHEVVSGEITNIIWVMDVSNPDWHSRIYAEFADTVSLLGFDGMHLDNLGGSWCYKYNSNDGIPEWTAFPDFISGTKSTVQGVRPGGYVIHNDVYAGYLDQIAPSAVDAYYAEVWGDDHYSDLRDLILQAKSAGGGKAVVLAAYINRDDPVRYVNEASVRLLDACIFANGAFHIELGEQDQMLVNEYFPLHSPPMTGALKDTMRDYYSFIVRYENLLFFNTLGNVQDSTEALVISSASHTLSKAGTNDALWVVSKRWKDEFETVSLINLYGVDTLWRNRSAIPAPQTNIQIRCHLDKTVQALYLASPDFNDGQAVELAFIEGSDAEGYYVECTVPELQYWDVLIFDQRTTIKVDGWPGDWTGSGASAAHGVTVDDAEWIYTGEADDYRTFTGATADEDITEVRITSDSDYVYFLIRFQAVSDASLPAVGISWNNYLKAEGERFAWIGDASTTNGSIGLDHAEQYGAREIMFYSASGEARIRLFNGDVWYEPPAGDAAIAVSTADHVMEARINRSDLDCFYPQRITASLVSFRSSGNDAGNNSTYDSPDGNNDGIDLMGGERGINENSWSRDLSDNSVGYGYDLVLSEQGVMEPFEIAWPERDGMDVDLGPEGRYTVVTRFSEALPAQTNAFSVFINGNTYPSGGFTITASEAAHQLDFRFDWTDTSSGTRTVLVEYAAAGRVYSAQRVVELNPDSDGDTIPDYLEDLNRNRVQDPGETDFQRMDTDGDGLTDGFEDGNQDGWISGDTNHNFRHDAGELWWETDPRNADTDGDGLPDGWEIQHGLVPWDDGIPGHTNYNTGLEIDSPEHGADGDPDGDGFSNFREWCAGTDPRSAGSLLQVATAPLSADPQRFEFAWDGVSNQYYALYYAVALTNTFTLIDEVEVYSNGPVQLVPTHRFEDGQGFFRLKSRRLNE
jgi:dextranase